MRAERLLAIWRRYARVPWGRGILALASVCAVAFALGLAVGWPAVSGPAFQAPAGSGLGTTPPTPIPTPTPTPHATAPSGHAPKTPATHPARKPRPARHIRRAPAPPPWINPPPGFYADGQDGQNDGFWAAPPPPGWYAAPGGWGPHGEHGPHGGGRHGGHD